jgi:hypothetical protein
MAKLTLKEVNKHIQEKYPLIEVVKDDRGGLYLYSKDDKIALALAGLYSSVLDIHINSVKYYTLDLMMDNVERVLTDWYRFEGDRLPVVFSTRMIEKLSKNEYFRFPGKKTVYVAAGYNRSTKKYSYQKFEDINAFGERKKGTPVEIDFEF